MALSRFWLAIIFSSVVYILAMLTWGSSYSIDNIVNGKKDDPVLVKEVFIGQLPLSLQDTLAKAKDHKYQTVNKDTTYFLDNTVVKITTGKLATDVFFLLVRTLY